MSDCAVALSAIAGHDSHDSTSIAGPVLDYSSGLASGVKGLRLGAPKEYFVRGLDPGVEENVNRAIQVLEDMGATVDEVSLPTTPHTLSCYYILALSECSANLARYDGIKFGYSYQDAASLREGMDKSRQYGFGAEVKRRIMLGAYALSAGYYDSYYLKAQKVRTLIRREFDEVFQKYDALITPTTPTPAFSLGEKTEDPGADVPERCLHGPCQRGRHSGGLNTLRIFPRIAGWNASDRSQYVRGLLATHSSCL